MATLLRRFSCSLREFYLARGDGSTTSQIRQAVSVLERAHFCDSIASPSDLGSRRSHRPASTWCTKSSTNRLNKSGSGNSHSSITTHRPHWPVINGTPTLSRPPFSMCSSTTGSPKRARLAARLLDALFHYRIKNSRSTDVCKPTGSVIGSHFVPSAGRYYPN